MQGQVSAAGGGGEVGEYDIVYSLPSEGRYRMWIRVHGRDVQDSPFQVTRGTWLCGSRLSTAQVTCLPEEDSSRRTVRSYSASLPRPSSRYKKSASSASMSFQPGEGPSRGLLRPL